MMVCVCRQPDVQLLDVIQLLTLNLPRTHKCVHCLHKQQDFYGGFILGVNTLYIVSACMLVAWKGLKQGLGQSKQLCLVYILHLVEHLSLLSSRLVGGMHYSTEDVVCTHASIKILYSAEPVHRAYTYLSYGPLVMLINEPWPSKRWEAVHFQQKCRCLLWAGGRAVVPELMCVDRVGLPDSSLS